MSTRIMLLPGFGENTSIFRRILWCFNSYEVVHIDYRPLLNKFNHLNIGIDKFTQALIEQYNINANDILIGHSMGGYFSYAIREIVDCKICMIASFSNPSKIIRLIESPFINVMIAQLGILKTSFLQSYLIKPNVGKNTENELRMIMSNFNTFSNHQLGMMLRLTYEQEIISNKPNPLRIHSKYDRVAKPPDESYIEIEEGGHFNIIIESEKVANCIIQWMKTT